ncbi:MAG: hypothetical protein Q7J82_04365 [Coriobacteriia bacterium]|nr:hypothetical protein [Coriobacteriia bacterium]
MNPLLADAVAVILAVFAGWVLPSLVIAALVPSLEEGRVMTNYRGRSVFLGLGLCWIVWAIAIMLVRVVLEAVGTMFAGVPDALFHLYSGALGVAFSGMPLLLVAFAFVFGLVDDVFGTSAHKGFAGHLHALRDGKLTSGTLKLFGIGVVAMFYGWSASARVIETGIDGAVDFPARIGAWILATLVIGLSTNLFNLLDLRPGRALKSYVLFVVPLGVAFAARILANYAEFAAGVGDAVGAASVVGVSEQVAMVLVSLALLLGPVLAVWRYDLGERGMLGDAGSNVLGVIVGFLLVGVLPLWGFAVAAAVLLVLNLASERISFTAIIERTAPLRWLDSLGRLKEETEE